MSRYLEDLEPTAIVEGDYPCNCTWLGTVKAGDELYSAATVERLVQERDGAKESADYAWKNMRAIDKSRIETEEQLAAMTKNKESDNVPCK